MRWKIEGEDEDPLVELRRHRAELSKKYQTIEALDAYYRTIPSAEAILREIRKSKGRKPGKNKTNLQTA